MTATETSPQTGPLPTLPASTRGSSIGMCILGTPFLLGGAILIVRGIVLISLGDTKNWPMLPVGAVLAAVGAAFFYGGFAYARGVRELKKLQAEFPDEPWRWKQRWSRRSILDNTSGSIIVSWIIALFWNAIAVGATISALTDRSLPKGKYAVLILPAIGALLLAWALYLTARRMKFGRSVLELETMPIARGGWLGATLRIPTAFDASEGVCVVLSCIKRVVTGSGKTRKVNDTTLWRDEQWLAGRFVRDGGGMSVPVAFRIPTNHPTTRESPRESILWQLTASALAPGVDYKSSFALAVFDAKNAGAIPPTLEQAAAKLRRAEPTPAQRAASARFSYTTDAAGRMRFDFPAAANPIGAAVLSVIAAAYVWMMAVLMGLDISILILIPGWLIAALLVYSALAKWFKSRSVSVRDGDVEAAWRMLGFGRTRSIAKEDIKSVVYRFSGSTNDREYFKVRVVSTSDSEVCLTPAMSSDNAKWIAEQIAAAVGVGASLEGNRRLQKD